MNATSVADPPVESRARSETERVIATAGGRSGDEGWDGRAGYRCGVGVGGDATREGGTRNASEDHA